MRSDDALGGEAEAPVDPEERRQRVFQKALHILAVRPRSEALLRERLRRLEWADAESIDQCIVRLRELGYVNDATFAESYVNSRVSAKPLGRRRLARELASKKVAPDTIERALDQVLEETGDEALIDRAIARRLRTGGRPTDRRSSRKFFDHLMRLGFGYDLIVRKLRELDAQDRKRK